MISHLFGHLGGELNYRAYQVCVCAEGGFFLHAARRESRLHAALSFCNSLADEQAHRRQSSPVPPSRSQTSATQTLYSRKTRPGTHLFRGPQCASSWQKQSPATAQPA